MKYFFSLVSLVALAASASAATVELDRRISDPGNPADLINCPPKGGADLCTLEVPVRPLAASQPEDFLLSSLLTPAQQCNRIRINYGSQQQGHYIW